MILSDRSGEQAMKTTTACVAMLASGLALSACTRPPADPAASAPAAAASAAPAEAASVAEPAAKPVSDEALAWMEGRWCGSDEDQQIEESWFAPKKDEAIGMSRTVSGGRMVSFEFMRIASLDGVVTLLAQPSGDPAVPFKKTDGGDGWVRFENREHDYPQRIEYKRDGEGLTAEIGGPGAEGKEETISYKYVRCGK